MLGKIFLGVYYNLSIWYKLTNKNILAAYMTTDRGCYYHHT